MFQRRPIDVQTIGPAPADKQRPFAGIMLRVLPLARHDLNPAVGPTESEQEIQTRKTRATPPLIVPCNPAPSVLPEIVPFPDPFECHVTTAIVRPVAVQRDREHLHRIVTQSTQHRGQPARSATEGHPKIHAARLRTAQVIAWTVIDPVMPANLPFSEVPDGFVPDVRVQVLLRPIVAQTKLSRRASINTPLACLVRKEMQLQRTEPLLFPLAESHLSVLHFNGMSAGWPLSALWLQAPPRSNPFYKVLNTSASGNRETRVIAPIRAPHGASSTRAAS